MRGLICPAPGALELTDTLPEPGAPPPGWALLQVEQVGICGTDYHIYEGKHPFLTYPRVMGHEIAATVLVPGDGVTLAAGTAVIVNPYLSCGTCLACRNGKPNCCARIEVLGVHRDGALASHVSAPAASCHVISDAVPTALAALAEPLACVVNGTNKAGLRPGESAVVFGGGAIGCLFAAVFAAGGASAVVVVEPNAARSPVATAVGATHVLTPDEWAAEHDAILPGGADVVVDAVGSVLPDAIDAAGMGARVIVFGMNVNARPAVRQVEITEKGLTILGTYITAFTFPQAIRLLESGSLNVEPLVSAVLPLEHLEEGLAMLKSGAATKVVVTP